MGDNRSRYHVERDPKTGAVIWSKWRAQTAGQAERQRGFIAEGRAAGHFGYSLWEFCERRELETGPHTEYAATDHDRSQPSPYGSDDPRWWPHSDDDRRRQQGRLRAALERVRVWFTKPGHGDAYEGPDPEDAVDGRD